MMPETTQPPIGSRFGTSAPLPKTVIGSLAYRKDLCRFHVRSTPEAGPSRLNDAMYRAALGWGFEGCMREVQLHALGRAQFYHADEHDSARGGDLELRYPTPPAWMLHDPRVNRDPH